MNKQTVEALVESLKELLRTGLIAVIPVVIDGLGAGEVNLRLVAVAGAIAILRALDKLLHENNVKTLLDMKGLDALKK